MLDITFGRAGLVKGDKIIETLKGLVGDQLIEDLPVSFTAVASDIVNEREVWLNKGSLFDAIRASISLPLFFSPVERNGVMLLDGGILNPVPIAPTFYDETDIKIAVNLGGPVDWMLDTPVKKSDANTTESDMKARISQFIESIRVVKPDKDSATLGMLEIPDQSFDAMQGTTARQKPAAYPPDITLELPRNLCGTLEFNRADEIIAAGYAEAVRKLADKGKP